MFDSKRYRISKNENISSGVPGDIWFLFPLVFSLFYSFYFLACLEAVIYMVLKLLTGLTMIFGLFIFSINELKLEV